MRRGAIVLGMLLAVVTAGSAQAAPATQVHGLSPYPNPGGCHGADQAGTLFVNSEVEPWVGDNDNPTGDADPDSLIGTWQQDRFSSGGSSGLLVAYSHDGGLSWIVPPLSAQPAITNCQDPDNSGTNSDWERATDPWSDISPNGSTRMPRGPIAPSTAARSPAASRASRAASALMRSVSPASP